jgi:hypothetical protein
MMVLVVVVGGGVGVGGGGGYKIRRIRIPAGLHPLARHGP